MKSERNDQPVLATDGRLLDDRAVRKAMVRNVAAGAMGTVWAAVCLGMPLTMFLKALGASGLQLGMLVTVQQLAVLAQIPATFVVEELPARKRFWGWTAIPHRVVWLAVAVLPLVLSPAGGAAVPWVIGVTALSALLANAATPTWFSWMADLIPPSVSGRFWGIRQSLVMVAFLTGTLVSGVILDAFPDAAHGGSFAGFSAVFLLAAVLGTADIVLHLTIPEPRPQPANAGLRAWDRLVAPLRDRSFRRLTVALGLWIFSIGLYASFVPVYLKKEFGFSYLQLSLFPVCGALGSMVSAPLVGRLIDRIGAKAIAILLVLLGPVCGASWFLLSPGTLSLQVPWVGKVVLSQALVVLSIGHVAGGAIYGGVSLCQVHMASVLAPRQGRTMAMAVHWSIVGLMAAIAPTLGGFFMDCCEAYPPGYRLPFGVPVAFIHALLVVHALMAWGLVAPTLTRILRRAGELPLGFVLARLGTGSPLRAVINAVNTPLALVVGAVQRLAGDDDEDERRAA